MSSEAETAPDPGVAEIPESVSGIPGVWGDVRFLCDASLQAHVRGNVQAAKKLIVKNGAEVTGWVKGGEVCLEGKIQGGLEAAGLVWIKSGAILRQRCRAGALRIEPGVDFQGELQVGGRQP